MPSQRQITSFFEGGGEDASKKRRERSSIGQIGSKKRRRSSFGCCPICGINQPLHNLERHASVCDGIEPTSGASSNKNDNNQQQKIKPNDEPIPGLFLFHDFISEEEEQQLLLELDGESHKESFLPWKASSFNGRHFGKRWGVHCDLRSKIVETAENPMPHFMEDLIIPRLGSVRQMAGCTPNEANAIDYNRDNGHFLTAHVDDRQLSREPIANLSLVGDCFMTFRNEAPHRKTAASMARVFLPRRCLQVLTGKARYDFSHAIENSDLISPRRVSVTMRESPLTIRTRERLQQSATHVKAECSSSETVWWRKKPQEIQQQHQLSPLTPTNEPIPGLFVFEDFISEEEEKLILKELDNETSQAWATEWHSGTHCEKRFGIDHDLWNSKQTRAPKHALPDFVESLLAARLARIQQMAGCVPDEVNCLSYEKEKGHSLVSHVDDRHKHKEPIANLSLAGECIMSYRNMAQNRNLLFGERRVLLRRRCLQVLTGKSRYEFAHGISNQDLRSPRRVSVTMRCVL